VCWGEIEGNDPDTLIGARVTKVPVMNPCEHKTRIYQVVKLPPFVDAAECGVYQACWRNELASLTKRHLITEGEPQRENLMRCRNLVFELFSHLNVGPMKTPEEVIKHKGTPAGRRRYQQAFDNVRTLGWRAGISRVSAFVKIEKWDTKSLGVKAPRLIQFRCYEYCALISQYLLAIEEVLWKYETKGIPVFAKNMNSFKVAETIIQMGDDFSDPVYVLADHSKFDSCITIPWIWLEKEAYLSVFKCELFSELLDHQFRNKCYTKNGIRYECDGRKMSGEYNTSLGGCLINYAVLSDVFRSVRHRLLINGDDSVICIERKDLAKLDLSPDVWKAYGFKTGWEVVDEIEKVSFCQAQPVQLEEGKWRMVREPRRAIGRSTVSVKRYECQGWARLVASIGTSEMACCDGVPMLQAWAEALLRSSKGAKVIANEVSRRARLEAFLAPRPRVISDISRISFEKAFDISPGEQEIFEEWCYQSNMDILPLLP
jgi:hypothetical protein